MKAIHVIDYVKSHSQLRPINVPIPNPSQNDLLVKITHTSPTHVDLLYALGKHQNNHSGLVSPPFTLGLEFAGIVVSSPPDSSFKAADKVWGSAIGCFAEYITVPESAIHKIPRGWTCADAAGVGASNAPVSYGALVRCAGLKKGETLLVHAAAGGLGVTAVQIGLALGAKVIGTVGSDTKADVVSSLGADVIRYDKPNWEEDVKVLTNGIGVDVVYDAVGLVEKSIRCLKFGGRVVVAGFVGRNGDIEKVRMNRVLLKNARVLGYRYGESGRRNPGEHKAIWEGLNALLEAGEVKPVVCQTFHGLESVSKALLLLEDRKVYGKVLIEVAEGNEAAAESMGAKL